MSTRLTAAFLASLLAGVSFAALTLSASAAFAAPLKVACTGSSSMAGVGSSDGHHIADELGAALGPEFVVTNFAVAATTAIKSVPNAWASTPQMNDALASNPDVVLFWFGGNDSWVDVWTDHKAEFQPDYTSLVQAFQSLPSHPKTFLIRLWVFQDGPAQLTVLDQEILPMIDTIAAETNSTVIDYRTFIEPHPEWFPDGMHASDTGTAFIGPFLAEQVTAALSASADAGVVAAGGAGGAAGAGGAGGGGAPANVVPPTAGTAGAAASLPPAAAGSSGAQAAAAGTGNQAGGSGGSSAAAMPVTASGGSNEPAMTAAKGCGCRHSSKTPDAASAMLLLSLLAVFARRRQSS